MNKIKFLSNKYAKSSLLVIAGLLLGYFMFHQTRPGEGSVGSELHAHSEDEVTIWTCAMHPQIRMEEAGLCPICGMDLVPLQQTFAVADQQAIVISESAMKLAEIQTSIAGSGNSSKEVLLYGKIQPDERLLQSQTAHFPGRIEQLFINVTGESVKRGQLIAKIYAPELIQAQKELLEARSMGSKYPAVLEAAREKLRNWKLSEQQILDIETSGLVTSVFEIHSNTSGIVTGRKVNEGDYISQGTVLFNVADLSRVWALFDAYASDLPWISMGQSVTFTTQALPGKTFEGKVSFIDPVIDPATRIARVRVEISNPNLQLKPEMFLNGVADATMVNGSQQITVPKSAVLWTGTRSIVYVKLPDTETPSFRMREITLGAASKDSYVVLEGLHAGEEFVTNGTFSVDAAAQLAGKPSMMNPRGAEVILAHNHIDAGMNTVQVSGLSSAQDVKTSEMGTMEGGHQGNITAPDIDPRFTEQLTEVYKVYVGLKNAFVQSAPEEVANSADMVSTALNQVDMTLLDGETHRVWMGQLGALRKNLGVMVQNREIAAQREAFASLTQVLYQCIKDYGLEGVTTYYQFCPMALDNTGAFWLSDIEEIRNPYFGDAMLTCGETKETMEY